MNYFDEDNTIDTNMYFDVDEERTVEMNWECVSFIDAMRMADNAWKYGASFNIDQNLISKIVTSTPVKIVQSDKIKVDDHQMYILWGAVELEDADYEVPIRFYALAEEFDDKMFYWKTVEPTNIINLSAYVDDLERSEDMKWEYLLSE